MYTTHTIDAQHTQHTEHSGRQTNRGLMREEKRERSAAASSNIGLQHKKLSISTLPVRFVPNVSSRVELFMKIGMRAIVPKFPCTSLRGPFMITSRAWTVFKAPERSAGWFGVVVWCKCCVLVVGCLVVAAASEQRESTRQEECV